MKTNIYRFAGTVLTFLSNIEREEVNVQLIRHLSISPVVEHFRSRSRYRLIRLETHFHTRQVASIETMDHIYGVGDTLAEYI